jgi:hypothetical protein
LPSALLFLWFNKELEIENNPMNELPIIQKTYDLVKWYVPILNKLPRDHKFMLGERIITELYNFLEGLITARYSPQKLPLLKQLNSKLDILRYQTRLLFDFELISVKRYEYIQENLQAIGVELGGWIKQQKPILPG